MSTRRMISSDIWRDDFICVLNWFERLLWIGLIVTCADDQGRLQDRSRFILSDVFPNDDSLTATKVEEAMQTFATVGKIIRYEAGGVKLIQITKWWEYQSPSWAAPSKFPAPPGWLDRVKIHTKENRVFTENWDFPGGFVLPSGVGSDVSTGVPTPVPTHLPTAPPTPEPTGIEEGEGEVKGEGEGEGERRTAAAVFSPFAYSESGFLESIFSQVTGWTRINEDRENCIGALQAISTQKQGKTVEYLKPYFEEFRRRYPSSGRTFWLTDWAMRGEIPKKISKNGGESNADRIKRVLGA